MSKVRITNKQIINSVVGVIYQMHPMALKPKKDWTEEEKEKYKL